MAELFAFLDLLYFTFVISIYIVVFLPYVYGYSLYVNTTNINKSVVLYCQVADNFSCCRFCMCNLFSAFTDSIPDLFVVPNTFVVSPAI